MRALMKNVDMVPLYWARLPVHDPHTGEDGLLVDFPFILPHELMHRMIKGDPGLLEQMVCPPSGAMEGLKTAWCEKLQVDPSKTIPIGCFGDGVPHQKQKSVE
eukprot:15474066-Alexandrium_andersonii.AAC.1